MQVFYDIATLAWWASRSSASRTLMERIAGPFKDEIEARLFCK